MRIINIALITLLFALTNFSVAGSAQAPKVANSQNVNNSADETNKQIDHAYRLFANGQYEASIKEYQIIRQNTTLSDKQQVTVDLFLGRNFMEYATKSKKNDVLKLDMAIRYFTDGLATASEKTDLIELLEFRGKTYNLRGQYENAISDLNSVLNMGPDYVGHKSALLHAELGNSYYFLNRYDDALNEYNITKNINPSYPNIEVYIYAAKNRK